MVVSYETSLRHQQFGAWCAPIFTVFTIIGWLWLAHFWLPARADFSAAETAAFFAQHHDGMILGSSIWIMGCCFLAVFTTQLGLMLWQMEGRAPLWAISQVIAGAGIVILVMMSCCLWIGAAYRPGTDPRIVVALNDAAWIGLLVTWPILSLQMIATAMVTLNDRRSTPLCPRWVSYASLVGSVALVTTGGPAFTHSGPFAYHGVLGCYVPVMIWGLWLDGHAWYMRKELLRQRDVSTDQVALAA